MRNPEAELHGMIGMKTPKQNTSHSIRIDSMKINRISHMSAHVCDLVSLVVLGFACRLQEKKHMFIHSVARARGEDTLLSGHSIANKYMVCV